MAGLLISAVGTRQLKWSLRKHEAFWGLLFLAPALLFFAVFWIYPLLNAIFISFTDWDLFTTPRFVGFDNYISLFQSQDLLNSIKATAYYALGTVVLVPLISLGLALLLNSNLPGKGFFTTAFFVPAVISWIVAAILWRLIYLPNAGLYLLFSEPFGIYEIKWLTSRHLAMPAIIIVAVWKGIGPNMVLYLAGLQNLPPELFEAARVDGAKTWQVIVHITLPLLKPTTLFVLVTMIIGAFHVFTPVYLMTGGGPADVTRVLPMMLYQEAFSFYRMGNASAISVLMLLALLAITVVQLRVFRGDDNR